MSAIRKREQIQSVPFAITSAQTPLNSQATLQSQATLSSSAQAVLQQMSLPTAAATLEPVGTRRSVVQPLQQQSLQLAQQAQLSLAETTQVVALATAAAYSTPSRKVLQADWEALQQSGQSLEAAQAALQQFTQTLETQHQHLMTEQLQLACNRAALQVGFQPLQSSVALDGTLRLLASDETGRTLVTEISTQADQTLAMATELIGSSDASCEAILDAFDQALEAAGVTSGPPERKFTGGICELAAAREFIRQRPQPQVRPSQPKAVAAKKPQAHRPHPQQNRMQH